MITPLDSTTKGPVDPPSDTPLLLANVSRRAVLGGLSALGGLVLAVGVPATRSAADPPKYGADAMPDGWVDDPLAFVAIGEDGTVSIVCQRSEMGQGVRTGMPMIVADELEADWTRVRVVQAPGDQQRFGNQDTDGSRSIRHFFDPMRRCGAAARTMLETAAAARWKVAVSEVDAEHHEVVHRASGRRLGHGALARDAARLPVPPRETLRLKDPARFRYIGKGRPGGAGQLPRVRGHAHGGRAARDPRAPGPPGTSARRSGAWANRGCRRSRRPCATPSSPRQASASGACRSAISSGPERHDPEGSEAIELCLEDVG
jgi:isoquinoline 1-oxidoreductase beta subunit